MRNRLGTGAIVLIAGLTAGCQELVVENTNAPNRDQALSNPADVETLIASTWRDLWGRVQNSSSTTNVMTNVADETTATYANNGSLELSSEPRPYLNNSPLADVVDCQRAFVEATVPESRYDKVQLGDTVQVKLLGNSRKIPGTIHAVRGQSAVVNRENLAAWLTPRRTTAAMTVSVAMDPQALQQASKGVCQIGRSAKVYFGDKDDDGGGAQHLASLIGLVSSAYAAVVSSDR